MSPSVLWTMTSHLKFKTLELVKRDGPHPVIMVGTYTTNTRPRFSALKTRFTDIEAAVPGLFDKIQNPKASDANNEDMEVHFVEFPIDTTGALVQLEDDTGLCRMFMDIKEPTNRSRFRGEYTLMNKEKYDELERISDFKAITESGGLQDDDEDQEPVLHPNGKRRREDDSTLILGEASGAASTSAEERLKTQFAERERALGAAFDEKERGLKDEITTKDNELINKNAEIAAKNNELITKNAEITAKDNQFTAKNTELELLQGNYYALQLNAQEKDARIEELSDVIRRMETDLRRMETNGAAHGGGARRDAQPLADQHIQLQAPIIQPEAPGQWDLIDSPGLLRIQIGLQEGSIKKLKEDLDAANKETQRAYKQVRDEEARWAAERAEITNNPAGTRYYCDEMASIEKAKEHLRMITAMATRDADKMILQLKDEILDKEYNMIIMLSGKGNDSSFRGAVQHQFLDIYNKMTSDNTEAMNTRYYSKFAQDRVGKVQQAAGRGRGKR